MEPGQIAFANGLALRARVRGGAQLHNRTTVRKTPNTALDFSLESRASNIEPQQSVPVFKTKFNTPFAGVSSRNVYLGSLASQFIRFNLELAIEPGQDPETPVGVVKNNLRQRFS